LQTVTASRFAQATMRASIAGGGLRLKRSA